MCNSELRVAYRSARSTPLGIIGGLCCRHTEPVVANAKSAPSDMTLFANLGAKQNSRSKGTFDDDLVHPSHRDSNRYRPDRRSGRSIAPILVRNSLERGSARCPSEGDRR